MRTVTGMVVAALVLVGCGEDPEARQSGGDDSTAEGTTNYPVSMENCGTDVTVEQRPERIVTLNQTAAEILIRMGAGDRIVGSGYEIDTPPDDIAEAYQRIPLIGPKSNFIPHEKVLEALPDFIYSSFASFLSAAESGEREEFHDLGVPTYLTEFDCTYHEAVDDASFDLMFEEYERLGEILDVASAADEMIAEQRTVVEEGLAAAEGIEDAPSLLWFYSTYSGTPYAAGPGGIPQHVTDLVGAENIFDDAKDKWPEVSWDEVAARNPDVIVLADLTRGEPNDTAAEKIELLKKDPLTSQLDAVRNDRFIVVPGRYMDPSYGSVYALPAVAEGLVELQE